MGMFSEIAAGITAEKLETILTHAVAQGGEVKEFAKKYLYDWYLWECGDSFGIHEASTMLKREFEENNSPDLSNDSSPMNTFGHD